MYSFSISANSVSFGVPICHEGSDPSPAPVAVAEPLSPVASRFVPWPPVVSRGLPWPPVA